MARLCGEITMEEMLRTVNEAMIRFIDRWKAATAISRTGDLPLMQEAVEPFRTQLGAAIKFRRICEKGTR
jgi:hypothetical protein